MKNSTSQIIPATDPQTSSERGGTPPLHAPFRPVRDPSFIEVEQSTPEGKVFGRLISILRNARPVHIETGMRLNRIYLPAVRAAMLESGMTELDIDLQEERIISVADYRYKLEYDAPYALYHQLKRDGRTDLIIDRYIVAIPGLAMNGLICERLQRYFTVSELLNVPGFRLVRIEDPDGVEMPCTAIRIDLDYKLARSGFMMPIVERGEILALRVFRYPNDKRPFILTSRGYANV